MLDNLTFSQRRVHTVGVGVLLSAVMLCATPAFAQELRHVAEVLEKTSGGPVSFGPVSMVAPLCSATTGGPGCKFVDASESGTGKIVEGGDDTGSRLTWTREVTVLLVLTPSGAHDANGDPTGFCAPLFGPEHWVFEDGSTIDLNGQGSQCRAASSCSGGFRAAFPLSVTHVSTIITGGTGSFVGLKGGGERAASNPGGRIVEEQVWELPSVPED
jgi:hypothetical protein